MDSSTRLPATTFIVDQMSAKPFNTAGGGRQSDAALPWCGNQPYGHGQIDQCVDENSVRRTQHQQQSGAECRADQKAHIATRRAQAHCARQLLGVDDLMDQHLRGRDPYHARAAMDHQQQHRLPQSHGIRQEHEAPADRHPAEHEHAGLNQPANIDSIRQCAAISGKEQIGHPMRNHGKTAEPGRMKFLEDHPVTDDVLYVVGHHRRGGGSKINAKIAVGECFEGAGSGHGLRAVVDVQWDLMPR